MNEESRRLRDYDMRDARTGKLVEELRGVYPVAKDEALDERELAFMRVAYRSGVPLEYLVCEWDDYQASGLDGLRKAREFAQNLSYHIRSGGGLILIGAHGHGKTLLAYLIAMAAVRQQIPVACVTVREWADRRAYQRHNAVLYDEVARRVSEARLVVIDDLTRESERLTWTAEDVADLIDRVVGGSRRRAAVITTSMTNADVKLAVGSGVLSRLSGFEPVKLNNEDHRARQPNIQDLLARRTGPAADCFRELKFLTPTSPDPAWKTTLQRPEACRRCAYEARPTLCELRMSGKWRTP